MDRFNWKSIVAGFIVLITGILLILFDIFCVHTLIHLWVSIGCSLIASGLVILLNGFFVDRQKYSPLDEWGIRNIYNTRSLMNQDCDIRLSKAKYQVDVIGFGLKSYRLELEGMTKDLLRRGVNFRIITMDPYSPFVAQREIEEKDSPGQIKSAILDLIQWAEKLNRESKNGKIEIKGYRCMTLDFYWRVDDDIYLGPYWYGYTSQQTISYKFSGDDKKGFRYYTEYFNKLWDDSKLMTTLVPRSHKR